MAFLETNKQEDPLSEIDTQGDSFSTILPLIPNVAYGQSDKSGDPPSASFPLIAALSTSCSPSNPPPPPGTNGADTIYGTDSGDTINGLQQNDQLFGCGGDDTINGGQGEDLVDGGDGNDNLDGGNGKDTIIGGAGNDFIKGGNGGETLTGGDGADTFDCGHAADIVTDFDPTEGDTLIACENAVIQDTIPPVLTVPSNIIAEATSSAGAVVTFTVSANDAVDGPITPDCDHQSGDTFPLGDTLVTCTATDNSGNQATDSFTITVQDTTAPVLTVPDDQTVEATSADGAVVTFDPPSATDFFTPVTIECLSDTTGLNSGDTFPLGTTTITCTATDANGVESEPQSFTITVQDTTAPVLTVPDDQTVEATSADGAVVTFDPPSATDFFTPVTIECLSDLAD